MGRVAFEISLVVRFAKIKDNEIHLLPPQSNSAPLSGVDSPTSLQSRLQLAAVCALFVGYAVLSHFGYSDPNAKGLGAALSVAPVMLIAVIFVWRWTHAIAALLVAALLCAILYEYWPVVERHYAWSDLVQQCGVYALVTVGFARSLFGGRIPLCTQLAGKLHASLAPLEITHLRRATIAWSIFYAALTAAILILYFVAPLRIWSLFVNFAAIALIIAAGIIDLAIRYQVLPRRPGDGILAVIRRSLTG